MNSLMLSKTEELERQVYLLTKKNDRLSLNLAKVQDEIEELKLEVLAVL